MRRRLELISFTSCVIAMVLQSVAIASRRSLVLDEAVTLLHSHRSMRGEWLELFADIHMPVYNVLVALWMKAFGFEIFVAKTFSVVCGAFAVVMTFCLAKRFANRNVALAAVVLISFSPVLMQYSQLARSYSLFIAMSALSSYCFLRLSEAGLPLRSRWTIFYVLSTVGLMMTHMVGAGILVIQTLFIAIKGRRERSAVIFFSWTKVAPFVIVMYVPVAVTILTRYDLKSAIPAIYSWVPLPSLWSLVESVGYGLPDEAWVLGAFALFIAFAVIRRASRDEFVTYLLLWLLVPSLLLFVYSYLHHPIFIRRGMAPAIVPLVILAGIGIERMRPWVKVAGWVVVAGIVWWGFDQNVVAFEREEESWAGVAKEIENDRRAARVACFVRPGYAWPPLLYYLDRECFYSERPEACLQRSGIAPVGVESISGKSSFAGLNWFIGYGSDEKKNRELIGEFKATHGSQTKIDSFPDFRGFDAIRFTSPSKLE